MCSVAREVERNTSTQYQIEHLSVKHEYKKPVRGTKKKLKTRETQNTQRKKSPLKKYVFGYTKPTRSTQIYYSSRSDEAKI